MHLNPLEGGVQRWHKETPSPPCHSRHVIRVQSLISLRCGALSHVAVAGAALLALGSVSRGRQRL